MLPRRKCGRGNPHNLAIWAVLVARYIELKDFEYCLCETLPILLILVLCRRKKKIVKHTSRCSTKILWWILKFQACHSGASLSSGYDAATQLPSRLTAYLLSERFPSFGLPMPLLVKNNKKDKDKADRVATASPCSPTMLTSTPRPDKWLSSDKPFFRATHSQASQCGTVSCYPRQFVFSNMPTVAYYIRVLLKFFYNLNKTFT